MSALHLVIFKTPFFRTYAHWGLFLPYEGEDEPSGILYDVKKASLISKKTQVQKHDFYPRSQSDFFSSCTALPGISIKHYELSDICYRVSDGRPFNIVTSNCQHWVFEVIRAIAVQSNMTAAGEDAIRWIEDMR